MKKTKVYRPRRGIKFTNQALGVHPPASFVAGSITKTSPTKPKVNFSTKNFGVVIPSGSAMKSVTDRPDVVYLQSQATQVVVTSSMRLEGSLSYGRQYEKRKNNAKLLGLNSSLPFGAKRYSSVTQDTLVTATGSFERPLGVNNAFVCLPFSSIENQSPAAPAYKANALLPTSFSGTVIRSKQFGEAGNIIYFSCLDGVDAGVPYLDESAYPNITAYVQLGVSTISGVLEAINVSSSYIEIQASASNDTSVIYQECEEQFLYSGSNATWPISNETLLNYHNAGKQAVENSPVPASATLFYSKKSGLQTITVKHTASINDLSAGKVGVWAPSSFSANSGSLFTNVTGTNGIIASAHSTPASVFVSVPVSGKLVDIKVWVEIFHTTGTSDPCLEGLGVALRAPNLSWGHAHPMRNDDKFISWEAPAVEEFYRDSFLLWEGTVVAVRGSSFSSQWIGNIKGRYPTWNDDFCLRTVFSDGAPTKNPRNLYTSPSGVYLGSPNASRGINNAYGMNVPWISDLNIDGAHKAAGSPPRGWLTGPGGVAAINEWSTTGSNFGADYITAVYPLLDPIYCRKKYSAEENTALTQWGAFSTAQSDAYTDWQQWRGFRPGLRGTEISGSWQLLLMQRATASPSNAYYRQVRLEITYTTGSEPFEFRNSRRKSPLRPGPLLVATVSGSDLSRNGTSVSPGQDYFLNEVWTDVQQQNSINAAFGVKLDTGSIADGSWALLYKLSGSLADASGTAPGWLLNNQFGMPSIPISSSSLARSEYTQQSVYSPLSVMSPSRVIDTPKSLFDAAKDFGNDKSIIELARQFVSSSTT